jgi:hypothetical protein
LQLLSLLRVLPGQRYVGAGVWRGRPVLAKLLVGSKAARHFQRELAGVRLLAEQGLTTPLLLADGLQDGEGGWLLFDFSKAPKASAMPGSGRTPAVLADEQSAVLAEALGAIGQCTPRALWQEDLHLDNLLRQGGAVPDRWRRDPRETPGQPLSRQKVLENLGVFFAQLPKSWSRSSKNCWCYYLLSNGEHACPGSLAETDRQGARWRLKDYLIKVGRDCTLFSVRAAHLACGPFVARKRRRCCRCWRRPMPCSIRAICTRPAARRASARSRWPVARW